MAVPESYLPHGKHLDSPDVEAQCKSIERGMLELEHRLEEHDCDPDSDECDVPLAHGSLSISFEAARRILEMLEPAGTGVKPREILSWREDEAFVLYLVVIMEVAYRLYNTVVHRIRGKAGDADHGVNIVWKSWKEGVAEGEDFVDHGGWDIMFPAKKGKG